MKTFDLKELYKEYLQTTGLDEGEMRAIQKQETRRAFYGGCGHMLMLMLNEVSKLEESEGAKVLDDVLNQVGNFWIAETNSHN